MSDELLQLQFLELTERVNAMAQNGGGMGRCGSISPPQMATPINSNHKSYHIHKYEFDIIKKKVQ